MNWYKQIFAQLNPLTYYNIGHQGYIGKTTSCREFIWWISRSGSFTKKEITGTNKTHDDYNISYGDYSGRAELCPELPGKISVVIGSIDATDENPETNKEIPIYIKDKLQKAFGKNIQIHVFRD